MCKNNLIDLCKRPCHRDIVHGVKGGWGAIIKRYPDLKPAYDLAIAHHDLREKGLGCGLKTKVGQTARVRQAQS